VVCAGREEVGVRSKYSKVCYVAICNYPFRIICLHQRIKRNRLVIPDTNNDGIQGGAGYVG
jgi:hypothetical protein